MARGALVLAVLGLARLAHASITPGFPYGSEKVRGVNLGGWLVLEPWITPSIFDDTGNDAIVDEWTFGLYQDHATALATLTNHWNTWITESDFAAIAAAGLNHVRVPIGYWAFEVGPGEPYIQGALPYLDMAYNWAKTYGLKMIIDLHGAPGSQNGYDNSGHRVSTPEWYTNNTNVQRTSDIIKTLATTYANDQDVVSIIAPLNEPAGYNGADALSVIRQYWYDSYGNIRYPYDTSTEYNTVVLNHDAFQTEAYWAGFETGSNWDGVAFDTHIYQMFTDAGVALSDSAHISSSCSNAGTLESWDLWIIVGEWTPPGNDCAEYLNGRGIGSRYEGTYPGSTYVGSCTGLTGSASTFSSSYKTFLRQSWEAQVQTYEKGDGWVMWTWKTESADEWSYQAGLANGWIPQNPTDFEYPDICG